MKSTTLAGDAIVSVATIPLLVGVLAVKAGADVMQAVGKASEDIFQGDRLPVLKPTLTPDSSNSAELTASPDSSEPTNYRE